jgi:hypothetical protein
MYHPKKAFVSASSSAQLINRMPLTTSALLSGIPVVISPLAVMSTSVEREEGVERKEGCRLSYTPAELGRYVVTNLLFGKLMHPQGRTTEVPMFCTADLLSDPAEQSLRSQQSCCFYHPIYQEGHATPLK